MSDQVTTKPKNKGGRPLKFGTPKKLQKAIDKYFDSCYEYKFERVVNEKGRGKPIRELKRDEYDMVNVLDGDRKPIKEQVKPYTITGLCLALNTDRQTLLNYEKKDKYLVIIKRAKQVIVEQVEVNVLTKSQVAGPIFWLKANQGWVDKQVITGENGNPIEVQVTNFAGTSKK